MFIGIVLCYFIVLPISKGEDKLLAVSLLYRHGDRTPTDFYPTDPYQDPSFWPAPPGELTNIGKMQHYELGKWLRNRYDKFLSRIYNKDEFYVRSSDKDRCLMSAESNLAGLYPPQSNDVWNSELLWQPIPVHTVPCENDDIGETRHSCPKYEVLWPEAEEHSFFKEINERNKDLYEFLTKKTSKNISDICGAASVYDTISIEKLYNFTLPSWTNGIYSRLQNVAQPVIELPSLTFEMQRFLVGRVFAEVISQFHNIKTNSSDVVDQKFKMYSVHAEQVFGVLNVLKIKNRWNVPYAATVIFELRVSEDGGYYVQVSYKMDTEVADIVQIEGCELKCNFTTFVEILEAYCLTKEDYFDECV